MRSAPCSVVLCVGLALLACSSSSTTTTTIVRPQLLSVLPEDFLGTVTCSPDFPSGGAGGSNGVSANAGQGVVKSYVATLTDVTPGADGSVANVVLASSPPTPCSLPATFSYLVTYHYYTARIEAYTENAKDLTPFGLGSPLLFDASGNRVAARWAAECGGYVPSPGVGGGSSGGGGGADSGAAGSSGTPGVPIFDTVTQTPHDCGNGLTPIE